MLTNKLSMKNCFLIILIKGVKRALKVYFAPISRENHLRTIESSNKSDRLPLVLLHGMGGGVGLWVMNIDSLSEKQKVYAIDLLGFGRSSRPKFPKDALEAEKVFIQSLEEWRKMVGLEKFILLGQSFGGYLACSFYIVSRQSETFDTFRALGNAKSTYRNS